MELKSGSFIAGLLQGSAGAIEDYSRRKYAEEQYAARRREAEQFQMTERQNARQIRSDAIAETAAQKAQTFQTGFDKMQGYLKTPSKTPEEAVTNAADLSRYGGSFSSDYLKSQAGVFKDKQMTDPKWRDVPNDYVGKDGHVHTSIRQIDNNETSTTFGQYKPDPKDPTKPFTLDKTTSAGMLKNAEETGAGGSPSHKISPATERVFNTLSNNLAGANKAWGMADETAREGLLAKSEIAAAKYQTQVNDYMAAHPEFGNAGKVDAKLKSVQRDKAAYWNGVLSAYKGTDKSLPKLNDTEFILLRHKYQSLFGEPPPTSAEGTPRGDTPQDGSTKEQPKKSKATWKYE